MVGFHVGGRNDLRVGGWGPTNPYHVRIVKSVRNIGPSLIAIKMHICMNSQQKSLVYALGQEVPKLVYMYMYM